MFFIIGLVPTDIKMSRRSLYMIFKLSTKRKLNDKLLDMEHKLREITKCPESSFQTLTYDLKHFKSELKVRWSASNNTETRFLQKNETWLDNEIKVHNWSTLSISKQGRPDKPFQELSDRSKRRKTQELRHQVSVQELTYAASVSQRQSGNIDASKIIKEVTATPTRAKKIRKALRVQNVPVKKHSPSEALALFVECDLTKRQYEILHESNKSIYPCYSLLKEAKKECYPKEESTRVTESCAEVRLQDLLNHTTSRLCKYLEDVLETCNEEELANIELISKWGCDGSQQAKFHQNFQEESGHDDSNIFQSSLVPVRLQSVVGDQKKILWQNPTPSSPRFCRPIRIRFLHETRDITKEEIKYIEDQSNQLEKTEYVHSNSAVAKVQHVLLPTMVDGKVCNAATDTTSTMRCYICRKTSKDFNDLKTVNTVNPEALRFGISTLHARIRLLETLLHVAYKLPLKKWQVRGQNEKNIVKQRKEEIQKDFRVKTGLIVDVPKAGFGNTNSGNTSRRFLATLK